MSKFKKCYEMCDYENYYVNQALGKNPQNLFIQRGGNWFTSFARRFGIPALKFIGKQAFETGKDIFSDVVEGKDIKQSTKSNIKRGISRTFKDMSDKLMQQSGSGRKRKRKSNLKTAKKIKSFKVKPKRKPKRVKRKRVKRKRVKRKRVKGSKRQFIKNPDIFSA